MMATKNPLRAAKHSDLAAIANLYMNYMPHSTLSGLGRAFLADYLAVLLDDSSTLSFVEDAKPMGGFIMATTNAQATMRSLLCAPKVLLRGLAALLGTPSSWLPILALLPYPLLSYYPRTPAELLYVAIDPGARRSGLARTLTVRVLEELRLRALPSVKVCTNANNDAVNGMLRSLNFQVVSRFRLGGREVLLQWCPLQPGQGPL